MSNQFTRNVGKLPAASITEGDLLRDLISKRTGIKPEELQCPREKTFMTPCVARDGDIAIDDAGLCVGCVQLVSELLAQEQAIHLEQ